MILLALLLFVLLFSVAACFLSVGIGGIAFILVNGDVIVCVAILILIIRHLIKKRKKKEEESK